MGVSGLWEETLKQEVAEVANSLPLAIYHLRHHPDVSSNSSAGSLHFIDEVSPYLVPIKQSMLKNRATRQLDPDEFNEQLQARVEAKMWSVMKEREREAPGSHHSWLMDGEFRTTLKESTVRERLKEAVEGEQKRDAEVAKRERERRRKAKRTRTRIRQREARAARLRKAPEAGGVEGGDHHGEAPEDGGEDEVERASCQTAQEQGTEPTLAQAADGGGQLRMQAGPSGDGEAAKLVDETLNSSSTSLCPSFITRYTLLTREVSCAVSSAVSELDIRFPFAWDTFLFVSPAPA